MHPVKYMLRALLASVLLMMLLVLPAAAENSAFIFELDGETAILIGYTGSDTDVIVPGYYLCKPVTVIGAGAFEGKSLTSVSLPSTVVRIGAGAFRNCTQLSEITSHTATLTHAWDEGVTTPPTCAAAGSTVYTCTLCGATKTDVIDALGHIPEVVPAVPATCTKTGLTEGSKCSVCQTVLVEQEVVDALEHTWDDGVITTPPTATEDGVMTYTCTVCSATHTESIPATGEEPEPEVLRGDVNGDGIISLADLMYLVKHLNHDLTIDEINAKGADVNGDGKISLADLMYLVKILNHDV